MSVSAHAPRPPVTGRASTDTREPAQSGRSAHDGAGVPSVALVAGGGGASAAIAALMVARHGREETGVRNALRVTGRFSQVLFCLAFSASAMHRLRPGTLTRALLRRRRQVGLAMAASHAVHLLAILRLYQLRRGGPPPVAPAVVVVGGVGYALLTAMSATSNGPAVRWLGPRRWKRLHTFGGWYLFGVFSFDAINGCLNKGRNAKVYGPLAALLVAVAALRRAAARA